MDDCLKCVKCGATITRSDKGRPPIYCSEGCRRAAEHQIRRLNRTLQILEDEERRYRRELQTDTCLGPKTHVRGQQAWLETEIKKVEERLKQLLQPQGGQHGLTSSSNRMRAE